jgi:hypothetical protein
MLVQPRVVANGCKRFAGFTSTSFYEGMCLVCRRVWKMEATRSVPITLGGITASDTTDKRPMGLTTIAEIDVIFAHVPLGTVLGQRKVFEQTVPIGSRSARVWIRSSQELVKVTPECVNFVGLRPVNLVDVDGTFKPEEAVDVTCEDGQLETARGKEKNADQSHVIATRCETNSLQRCSHR